MCDRIQEGDERNEKIKKIFTSEEEECLEINKSLESCLIQNERDFRKCKKELALLKECMTKKAKFKNE